MRDWSPFEFLREESGRHKSECVRLEHGAGQSIALRGVGARRSVVGVEGLGVWKDWMCSRHTWRIGLRLRHILDHGCLSCFGGKRGAVSSEG